MNRRLSNPEELDRLWRRLINFTTIVVIGWVVAIAFHHVLSTVFGCGWPHGYFLFDPNDRYSDLLNSWHQAMANNPYVHSDTAAIPAYFPFVYWVLSWFSMISQQEVLLLYATVTFGGILWLAIRQLSCLAPRWREDSRWLAIILCVLTICFLNYPLIFAFDRGGLDPLIMVLFVASLTAIEGQRQISAGLLLALSAAAKGFTLVGVLPLLRRRQWLAVLIALSTVIPLVVLPGLSFEGGLWVTLHGLGHGLAAFQQTYVLGDGSAHYCADVLNALRLTTGTATLSLKLVHAYEIFTMGWAGILAFHVLFLAQEVWRERLGLVLIMLVFPNVTNDYKLILLLPVVLEWLTAADCDTGWRNQLFLWCAALLFVPKHFYYFHHGASISCLISPFLLLGLSAVLWPNTVEHVKLGALRARLNAGFRIRPTAGKLS